MCRKLRASLFKKSETTVKYSSGNGTRRFRANGKRLRATQTYPKRFGRAVPGRSSESHIFVQVCNIYRNHSKRPERERLIDFTPDAWADARCLG